MRKRIEEHLFDGLVAVPFFFGDPVRVFLLQRRGSSYPLTFVFVQHELLSLLTSQCLLVLCLKKEPKRNAIRREQEKVQFLPAAILA